MTVLDPSIELMQLINAYRVSQALHVAASLGVADQLKDGPMSSDALAQACGTLPRSLYRLLRALAAAGVRYWHKADITRPSFNVRYWGKADIGWRRFNVRF